MSKISINSEVTSILRIKSEELQKLDIPEKVLKLSFDESQMLINEFEYQQKQLEMLDNKVSKAESAEKAAQDNYKELYDFAPSGFVTLSAEGNIIMLNLTAAQMLCKERSLLTKSRFSSYLSDDSQAVFNLFLCKIFKYKTKRLCQLCLSSDSRFPLYVSVSGIACEDGQHCFITMLDVTEQVIAEEALNHSRVLLKSCIESQKDTIILAIDKDYKYLYFNKAHWDTMMFAYGKDIKIGMNILDCITNDEDRKAAKDNYDRAMKGESHTNIRIYGTDEFAYYESFFNPIINNYSIIGATALARNITERKVIEIELTKKIQELELCNNTNVDYNNIIKDLKKEVNELLKKSGQQEKYNTI